MKPLHVGISVRNIDEAIAWYGDVLGFELQWKNAFDELKSHIAFMIKDGFQIELFEHFESIEIPKDRLMPKEDIQTQGTKHIAFATDDIETLFADFRQKGVEIVFGPVESPPKDAIFGFIRDPSGVLIEFIQQKMI